MTRIIEDNELENVSGGTEMFGRGKQVEVYTDDEYDNLKKGDRIKIYSADMRMRVYDKGQGTFEEKDGYTYTAKGDDGQWYTIDSSAGVASMYMFGPIR